MANETVSRSWYKMDLHLHTPASADYQEPHISYLDILKQAELRGLDIIAFTDHNTVKGYSNMLAEIDRLTYLEQLGRAEGEEIHRLSEYRRLLKKILVLPGFEFTATFGFHILGIFAPQTPIRQLEHVLLSLNVPVEALEEGTSNVGASSDVITAYRVIREAGGLVIAAHVNTAHGVAMRGMDFGGQTRIAYTQDSNLHALEVTDLEKHGRFATARFFDGAKHGYSRRMRCIQGSDAHRLEMPNPKSKDLGIGDRVTEIYLPFCSFDAMKDVLENNDFTLTRPYNGDGRDSYDAVKVARQEGESILQVFHPSMAQKGNFLARIIEDVCALANTNGGTVWVGVSSNPNEKPIGIPKPETAIETLSAEIDRCISPHLDVTIDTLTSQKKSVLRLQVPKGEHIPYAVDDFKIYIRDEAETSIAVRDEIVRLVLQSYHLSVPSSESDQHEDDEVTTPKDVKISGRQDAPPLTGVEIIGTEKRRGTYYHMMRDLRNNNIIHNVTRYSARRLWHYAIVQTEDRTFDETTAHWQGDCALVRRYKKAGAIRYDLAHRVTETSGKKITRIYYGVTEDGMLDQWAAFISDEDIPEEGWEDEDRPAYGGYRGYRERY